MGNYKIIVIGPGWTKDVDAGPKAPSTNYVAVCALNREGKFAAHYAPSKKGWWLYDVREAVRAMSSAGFREWQNVVRLDRVFPNEDAAVMYAMMQLGKQPATS